MAGTMKQRANFMLSEAHDSMESGRSNRMKQMRRHFTRDWKYGGLKKKVTKIAVGAAFGAIAVGISAASFGTATPVIIALAVGGYAVSQMTDAGAAAWGRKYKGARHTRSWMSDFRQKSTVDKRASMFAANERAHKTIRRAFQHYRKAVRKHRDLKASFDAVGNALMDGSYSCSDNTDMVLAAFSVSHHLDKALAYLEPAVLLCGFLLESYRQMRDLWVQIAASLPTETEKFLTAHGNPPKPCEAAREPPLCFATADFDMALLTQTTPHTHVTLWTDAEIGDREKVLDDIDTGLPLAGFAATPPSAKGASRSSFTRTDLLFEHAAKRYASRRSGARGRALKVKHYVTNYFAMRTKRERVAFGVGQFLKVGMSAGGGTASGFTAPMHLPAYVDPLQELGSQLFENIVDWGVDVYVEDQGSTAPLDIDHHKGATLMGAEMQETLQKSAIHMHEIIKREEAIKQMGQPGNCEEAFDYLRELYKVEHHLQKTQTYLGEAIEQTSVLGKALIGFIDTYKQTHDLVFKRAYDIISRSHANCEGGVCYGPKKGNDKLPVRPLT